MATGVVLDDILTAHLTIVQSLALVGLPAANILIRFVSTLHEGLTTDQYPAILIVPGEQGEEASGETFEDELDYKYRVTEVIVARNNRDMTSNRNRYLQWRQQIRGSALAGGDTPMLPGASTVWDTRQRPGPAFDRRLLRQFAAMAITFEHMSHESRSYP